jgi:hypothetical protein
MKWALVLFSLIMQAISCCATAQVIPRRSRTILPAEPARPTGTVVSLKRGELLGRARPGWTEVAVLKDARQIPFGSKMVDLKSGSILVRAYYQGNGDSGLPSGAAVYCGQTSYAMNRASGLFGIIAASAQQRNSNVVYDPNLCVADTDGNGSLDSALRIKAGNQSEIAKIDEAAFDKQFDVPVPGDSRIEIRYMGLTSKGAARFRLLYVAEGRDEQFLKFRYADEQGRLTELNREIELPTSELTKSNEIAGLRFSISQVDKGAGTIVARIERDFVRTTFGLTVERLILLWF